MQQAGATPAEAMALTLSSAHPVRGATASTRGMDPDQFLPRFTFFFDISISFFEEVAKFRAGRRIWARLTRERLRRQGARARGASSSTARPRASISPREQPLNNIARVAVQAMAGIFGGLQSLHTDAYDEAISVPTEEAARIAVATQNILQEEAHLTDVIDPLGGSYYVETLTDQMEARDPRGDRPHRCGRRHVQGGRSRPRPIHDRARRRSPSSNGWKAARRRWSGSIAIRTTTDRLEPPTERPDLARMAEHVARFKAYKEERSPSDVRRALDALARAANSERENVFERIVEAAEAGITHGEIVGCLRKELGFGHPLVTV